MTVYRTRMARDEAHDGEVGQVARSGRRRKKRVEEGR